MNIKQMDIILEKLGFPEYEIKIPTRQNIYSPEDMYLIISHPSTIVLKKLIDEIFPDISGLRYEQKISDSDYPSIIINKDEFEDFLVKKYMK